MLRLILSSEPYAVIHVYRYLTTSCSPRQFLSSGRDLVVQMWEILDHNDNDERVGLGMIRDSESTILIITLVLVLILELPLLEYSPI